MQFNIPLSKKRFPHFSIFLTPVNPIRFDVVGVTIFRCYFIHEIIIVYINTKWG